MPADPLRSELTYHKGAGCIANLESEVQRSTCVQVESGSEDCGLPQIYTMDQDGANVKRLTDGGYAVSALVVSERPVAHLQVRNRKYGPGAPGGQDIYVMDIATKRWLQLSRRCRYQRFSCRGVPDGRHIVFEGTQAGRPYGDMVDAGGWY